jgi:Fe-S oxidoreductase
MTPGWLIPALVAAALAIALVGAYRRARRWRVGRPAQVEVLRGLAALPKRYLVDLHGVVARDRFTAAMHVLAAGGLVASLVLLPIVHLPGLELRPLAWALLGTLAATLAGASMAALRRLGRRPARLSAGAFNRLPASLMAYALGAVGATLPAAGLVAEGAWTPALSLLFAALIAWGLAEVLIGATWGGPMRHAFAGALHLAFHPRPERFSGAGAGAGAAGALEPLDLEAAKLGAETPADLAWNQLLGFDACVQCGRCEEACPAFAAGQPLNPKKLVQDLVVGLGGPGGDAGYRGRGHPGRGPGAARGGPALPIVPELVAADTIWACTTCRACVDACPMFIEHVDVLIDMRRFLTLERGATPARGAAALEALRATDNPGGFDPATRLAWASDLDLPRLDEGGATDTLLWLGHGAFELRGQRSLRALVRLLRAAGVDFAVLGEAELDCGDLARRLGDEATFQDLARRNIESLARRRFRRIVSADPHACHALKHEYPALGGDYSVVHHTTLLAELLESGRLVPARRLEVAVTYHDPCYLGRYDGEVEAPRRILDAIGAERREMALAGLEGRCCGGGGGAAITDIPGARRIPDLRMDDARATGAETIAVACPTCCQMLEGVIGPRPEVKDVAELLLEAVEG